ncbi:SDR family NAD(P)-dependent oxidoreductase [Actinoplanes regularis]|uniref:High-affinity nickel permease n=1 Tax=Actinoplanes regularis TaxID=52697 RepID=A0A239JNF0_9ACTN|nr:SDR family NAD(P)-dependent oxidoreductase [Actinoplanes regularis]GIE92100.1 hypothetical protein Are01nite_85800 [Actinoplanes regularis]SNT07367.1 High-affinity nickel permease [Actinoplanes regularis]
MGKIGRRRGLAVVVLLQLAAFAVSYRFGAGWAVFVVAYLLGLRWAVEPGNAGMVGRARARLVGLGRPEGPAGVWFAVGFAATVAGLAFLVAVGLWMFPRLVPGGDYRAVFLGLLAILQVVVLIGAVRAGRRPVARPGVERLVRWVRRVWQLSLVGAVAGVGLVIAVEVGLLVLAAGRVAVGGAVSLAVVFAAGMSLMALLQRADAPPARQLILHIVFTGIVAGGALIVAGMMLGFSAGNLSLDGVTRTVDDAQEQPADLVGFLLERPGLLLVLVLIVIAVLFVRRMRAGRKGAESVSGRGEAGFGAQVGQRRRVAVGSAGAASGRRVVGTAEVVPSVAYGQRVVARASIADPGRAVVEAGDRVSGEIAIVVGAGAGVGRAIAFGLAEAGYGILAVDVDGDSAAACAVRARGFGVPAQAIRADLRDPLYLERIVALAEEWGRTGVLVTAGAGGWPSFRPGRSAEVCLGDLVREPMRQRGGGAVVNVVAAVSAEAPGLMRFAAEAAGARDGVRLMCLTTEQPVRDQAAVVTAVLDLVRRGSAGAVVELGGGEAVRRFARGYATPLM